MLDLAILPACAARHVDGELVYCLHPQVRTTGRPITPKLCAHAPLDHVCPHVLPPGHAVGFALKTPADLAAERAAAELARASSPAVRPVPAQPAQPAQPCIHRGLVVLREERCQLCGARDRREPVYSCAVHGECTLRRYESGTGPACCLGCPDYSAAIVS